MQRSKVCRPLVMGFATESHGSEADNTSGPINLRYSSREGEKRGGKGKGRRATKIEDNREVVAFGWEPDVPITWLLGGRQRPQLRGDGRGRSSIYRNRKNSQFEGSSDSGGGGLDFGHYPLIGVVVPSP
ncbi:hypothetical protein CRG98_048105 [Punica granatum]|uniref:Uncharacterized protein n=1 Tax=Punica granatum TaxID=22663 RepID=A0A2I0HIJ1_PUNGR|nr:hypothetical protein CRG98_048105 [Punica granatum]